MVVKTGWISANERTQKRFPSNSFRSEWTDFSVSGRALTTYTWDIWELLSRRTWTKVSNCMEQMLKRIGQAIACNGREEASIPTRSAGGSDGFCTKSSVALGECKHGKDSLAILWFCQEIWDNQRLRQRTAQFVIMSGQITPWLEIQFDGIVHS